MEENVRDLPYTDEPTKVIIQELVDRKRYFQRKKMHYKFILLLAFICTLMFVSNFLVTFYSTSDNHSIVQTYLLFHDDKLTWALLLMTAASFLLVKFYKVGLSEAKADYKALRLEVIQKGTDLWQEIECWTHRHQVFSKLKEDYDINLFYEND